MLRRKTNEKKITLLALSQLNKEIEKRQKFAPKPGDIRDSSKIVNDASVLIFGIWPWKVENTEPKDNYYFYITKNRNRDTVKPVVCARWDGRSQLFSDAVSKEWDADAEADFD